jgi:GH15 family glucan-1,4-alpha-glucosidase
MTFSIQAGESAGADYWIAAGDSQTVLERVHKRLLEDTPAHRLERTRMWWEQWFEQAETKLKGLEDRYLTMTKKSLMVIKAHCDRRGGIIASCDSSIYNYGRDYYSYVWPRDGAYAVWPLIRLGLYEEAKKFFLFCRDTLTDEGYMMHKYQPDRAIGSTWHPLQHGRHSELAIQEDETACIIFMLGELLDYSEDFDFIESMFETYVKPAAQFLVEYVDAQTGLPHASYDLWEEKFLTSTYTTAITYRALKVAARLAHEFGYAEGQHDWEHAADELAKHKNAFWDEERHMYRKGFLLKEDKTLQFDSVLDISSFYAMYMYEYETDKTRLKQALKTVEDALLSSAPSGGSPRYEDDKYFASEPPHRGNPWIVTTLWIAQFYVRVGNYEAALLLVDWALERALPSGVLAEQFHPETGAPIGVTPLVWSHAELVNTVLDLHEA